MAHELVRSAEPVEAGPVWAEYDPSNCSIAAAVGVLGDRWSWLLLREAFQGTTRFALFQQRLGIARDVLTVRLNKLVEAGLLRREPYRPAGGRTRYEYRLTRAGVELQPALIALLNWGDEHLRAPEERALHVRHTTCGAPLHAVVRCEQGHDVPPEQVTVAPGPGARRRTA